MKHLRRLMLLVLAVGGCMCGGCGRSNNTSSQSQSGSSNSSTPPGTLAGQGVPPSSNNEQSLQAAVAQSRQEYDQMVRTGQGLKIVSLPNPPTGPGMPLPDYVNFYEISDRYPTYLLCTYKVNENHYDPSNEPGWFQAALLQIRGSGPGKFPSTLQSVAIIIANSAEWSASTFEQCHKVGAIFNLKDVFDPSRDPSQLVAQASMDHHPFVYDPQQPTTDQQQSWVIVERAMGAGTAAGPQ